MARTITGTVSSASPDKTIVISVVTHRTHPIYKKQFVTSKKFMAHDENNECKVGDRVSIVEVKPISARKRFKLDKVLEKAELTREELSVLEPEVPVSKEKKEEPEEKKTEKASKTDAKSKKAKDSEESK
jgi:small subunit ribosomal protein S17